MTHHGHDPNYSRPDQALGIDLDKGEVERDLLAEILADLLEGLRGEGLHGASYPQRLQVEVLHREPHAVIESFGPLLGEHLQLVLVLK